MFINSSYAIWNISGEAADMAMEPALAYMFKMLCNVLYSKHLQIALTAQR